MSQKQAEEFANTYSVVDQFTDSVSGFSGTVFADQAGNKYFAIRGTEDLFSFAGAADWLTNVADVSWDGIAIRQGIALFNYLQRLQGADGNAVVQYTYDSITKTIGTTTGIASGLLSGQQMSVTGHSLGGHLAMMMSRLVPGMVSSVYTYNAPGFDTDIRTNLFPLTSEGFFNLLTNAPIGPITGQISAAWNDSIMTHWNVAGDVVHDIGNTPGIQGMIFSENANQGAGDAHDIKAITDSLAIYNLFATLDANVTVDTITAILQATASGEQKTLEWALDAVRTLFQVNYATGSPSGNAVATRLEDRNDLYINLLGDAATSKIGIQKYLEQLPWYDPNAEALVGFSIQDLAAYRFGAEPLAAQAQSDIATRYALYKLNPFTVSGANDLYSAINTDGALDLYDPNTRSGNLTEQYLNDRATFLGHKLQSAFDNTEYETKPWALYGGAALGPARYFKDNASGYAVYAGLDRNVTGQPLDILSQYLFGSKDSDTLEGGDKGDKLYGMDGADTLQGNKGNDYLEGGKGTDTYIYVSGDGTDTILDTDHQGQIQYDGILLNGGKKTGDYTYRSQDGKFLYTLIPQLDNLLGITGPDGNLLVKDFTGGDLGITLNPADPLAPPQNALTGDQSQPGQNDDLDATAGTDAIYGLAGNDVLSSHAGKNGYVSTIQLYGGTGNDGIYGEY